jgi:porin
MRLRDIRFYAKKGTNMNRRRLLLGLVFLIITVNLCKADDTDDIWSRETLTNGFCGLNGELADWGIEVGFGITNIYQQNVKGGRGTRLKSGRYTGSYDFEMLADLEKLVGFETGIIFLHLEGGWPDAEGIDGASLGSCFCVNVDAIGDIPILVKQLFYEGPIIDDNLTLMIGKIDFTGVFDRSAYADDEITQFINGALVNDPTIPFPGYSLGAVLVWDLTDLWYIMVGVADAQADGRETGFRTTFHGEDYFFYVLETGTTPELNSNNGLMPGAYRAGIWNDPQPKANTDYEASGKSYRDDIGFYISCDQMLIKENDDPEDGQGLGVFGRYGCAHGVKNDVANFWSIGFQYQGLFEARDEDVLGLGFAQGFFSDQVYATYTADYESILEAYYSASVTPWLNVSPNIQYIANPGGVSDVDDAWVLGVRIQMIF